MYPMMAIDDNGGLAGARASGFNISMEELSKQEHLDREQLARLGKRPVLKRNFGYMSILGFSCTVLITWEGVLVLFGQGLQNGGPTGVIIGFLIVWLGNLSVFTALSELASMAPTSGGQYHWVAMLAPRSCSKFLSYVTGWLTVGGWQGSVASSGFLTGTLIQGLITLTVPEYMGGHPWQGTLLMWAVILFAVLINSMVSSMLPKFEGLILILHVLGFFALLIPLVQLASHHDADFVFHTFQNLGGFPTLGLSFMVGMIGNVYAFSGADAAFHMSEEIQNPSVMVPRSVLTTIMVNGTAGFVMTLAMLFCMGDPEALADTKTGYPFMDIFLDASQNVAGSATMVAVIIILGCCGTVGILASSSRVFWSFARDRGLPGWRILSKVNNTTSIPLYAIAVTTTLSCLLGLINLGSSTAFNDIVSLSVSGLHSSYLIAASLLLYRRCTSGFKLPDPSTLPALANVSGDELVWGPWHIPGALGIINNVFACVYLVVIWFFSFWPPMWNPDAAGMNYSSLVTGSVAIFSVCYYFLWGKGVYMGPIVEI